MADGGKWPTRAHHRFATLVDAQDRDTPSTAEDPDLAADLALVGALRAMGTAAGPDDDARARMRARVLAAQPGRIESTTRTATGDDTVVALPARRTPAGSLRGRLLVATAAAMCLLMSLSGMSVLLARDSVPGDTLYGIKRSAETAELGLTFGDEAKALKHLRFATSRVDELEVVVSDGADAGRVWRGLDDFDADALAATRLFTAAAGNGPVASLSTLDGWAEQQRQRLVALEGALPVAERARVAGTLAILDRVRLRAAELGARSPCLTVTSGIVDDIGPRPADTACVPGDTAVETTTPPVGPPDTAPGAPGTDVPAPFPGVPGAPVPGPDTAPQPPAPGPSVLPAPGQPTPPPADDRPQPDPLPLPIPLPTSQITAPPWFPEPADVEVDG